MIAREGMPLRAAILALALSACAEPAVCAPADLAPLDAPPAYALVASDYASSAIGLLDAEGNLVREAWLDSGTVVPSVVTALSGDAVLGSAQLDPCVLTVIDRRGTDVITFLDLCTHDASAVVRAQLDVGASFDANPQDAIPIDDDRALVSRFDPNRSPDALELDRGNDLLVIDWRAPSVLARIDLSELDADVSGERMYARPGRMALLTSGSVRRVVIALARLSADWSAGPGAIGVLELDTMRAHAVALEGLGNCSELDVVPGSTADAIVTCAGAPYGSPDDRRAGAGIARVTLGDDGDVSVSAIWRAVDHPSAPVFDAWSVPLSRDRVVTVAMGDLRMGLDDRAGTIELSGDATPLFMEAGDAFVLGDGAFDPDAGSLLVPDADRGGIRRVQVMADGSYAELEPIETSGCRGLPPRELRRLAPP